MTPAKKGTKRKNKKPDGITKNVANGGAGNAEESNVSIIEEEAPELLKRGNSSLTDEEVFYDVHNGNHQESPPSKELCHHNGNDGKQSVATESVATESVATESVATESVATESVTTETVNYQPANEGISTPTENVSKVPSKLSTMTTCHSGASSEGDFDDFQEARIIKKSREELLKDIREFIDIPKDDTPNYAELVGRTRKEAEELVKRCVPSQEIEIAHPDLDIIKRQLAEMRVIQKKDGKL